MNRHITRSGLVLCTTAAALLAAGPPAAADNTMYIAHGGFLNGDPYGGELGIVDIDTGDYTSLGMPLSDAGITGLAFRDGFLYASTSNHSLAIIDCEGGLLDETPFFGSGFDPDKAGDRINDLATDKKGRLFATGRLDGTGDALFRVNPNTAELTLIGALPTHSGGFDAVAARGKRLYAHETNGPGAFDEIDPSTGASIDELPGGVPGGALGLAYNSDDGLLWASTCCNEFSGDVIYCIDPATGDATLMFDYDDDRKIQDIEFVPDTAAIDKSKIKRGEQTGGKTKNLRRSNNRYLKIASESTGGKYQTQTIINLTSPCPDVSRLDLRVETAASRSGATTKVQLYNYNSGGWQTIDSFPQSTSDSVMNYNNLNNPNRFIRDSDGQIRLRLTSIHNNSNHTFKIDYVRIRVEH